MISYLKRVSMYFLMTINILCSSVVADVSFTDTNLEIDLENVKGCFSEEGINSSTLEKLPKYLHGYLQQVEAEDFVSRYVFRSGEIKVNFRKSLDGISIVVSINIDPHKEGCEKFSVYEVLS